MAAGIVTGKDMNSRRPEDCMDEMKNNRLAEEAATFRAEQRAAAAAAAAPAARPSSAELGDDTTEEGATLTLPKKRAKNTESVQQPKGGCKAAARGSGARVK